MKTIEECERYLAEVGLATVLPARNQVLPCLLWAARGHEGPAVYDRHFERIWLWKDELPARRSALAGRLFGNQVCLLHRDLAPAFTSWRRAPASVAEVRGLYRDGLLSQEAKRLVEALADTDELGRRALRRAVGLAGKADKSRFERACRELERRLILTRAGRASDGPGWDSCTYALVLRRFPDLPRLRPYEAEEEVHSALLRAGVPESRLDRLMAAR